MDKLMGIRALASALFVFLFFGCGDPGDTPGQTDDLEGMHFDVDSTLSPSQDRLDGDRRLIGVVDETGEQLDYVAEELLFLGDEGLDEFLDRWDGEHLDTVELDELDADLEPLHHIRVDPDLGDSDRLTELFEEQDEVLAGDFTATDDEALGLLAIAVEEQVERDNEVLINPYFPFQADDLAYIDQELVAAPDPADGNADVLAEGGSYDPNPETWVHYNSGSTQDVGVTDAWRALALAGLADPEGGDRIDMLILDGGFLDLDLPEGSTSAIFGSPNLGGCGSGNPCPWHGIGVAQVAAADPHSGTGVIGAGGPVVRPSMVGAPGDFLSAVKWLVGLGKDLIGQPGHVAGTPQIINMSFGGNVHWGFDRTLRLTDLTSGVFLGLRRAGILSFAAAGNDSDFLHEETCPTLGFGSCFERHSHLPCQASGVVCVGGLADDGLGRFHRTSTSGSNYGRDVDLWASFRQYQTLDVSEDDPPDEGEVDEVYAGTGTSYSSPFVAGVAALVMAADPSLSPVEVRDLLVATARDGEGRAGDIVQARAAVYEALGGAPFDLSPIEQPAEGSVHERGRGLFAQARLRGGDFPTTITWRLNGEVVGHGPNVTVDADDTRDLAAGTHELTVTAEGGPYELTRTREVEFVPSPPEVSIQFPSEGQVYYESSTIPLLAFSSSAEAADGELSDGEMSWTVSSTGDELATGHQAGVGGAELGVGTWTLVVTGDDGNGIDSDEVTITVEEDPDVVPPDALISLPEDGDILSAGQDRCDRDVDGFRVGCELEFDGSASDSEGTAITGDDLVWTTTADENDDGEVTTRELGRGGSFTAMVYEDSDTGGTLHIIELTATDEDGVSRTVSVEVQFAPVIE